MLIERSGNASTTEAPRPRALICTPDAVWLWPGTELTQKRGDRIVPLPRDSILRAACMLFGPAANQSRLVSAVECAADRLNEMRIASAQAALNRACPPLSPDGCALMTVVAKRLGVIPPALDVGAGSRLWNPGNIETFSRYYDARFRTADWLAPVFARGSWDESKHPRWPGGSPGGVGGRFAPANAGGPPVAPVQTPPKTPERESSESKTPEPRRRGIGDNGGPPLFDDAPPVPLDDPGPSGGRWQVIKRVARWTTKRIGILGVEDVAGGGVFGMLFDAAQIASWVHDYLPYIRAYNDPPKTLAELQAAALGPPRKGYEVHHIVWQTDGGKDGIPNDTLQSPENLVSISTLRHWELNSWFQTPNDIYGGLTPRDYLRGKDYETRVHVGLDGLRKIGVLKP